MNPILQAAKDYVELGWYVFPLHSIRSDGVCTCGKMCGDEGKHPRVTGGLKQASRDLAKIEEWFGDDAPLSNIGVVTGEISGITVLDIDMGEGKFGAESWAEAIKEHGEPDTLIAKTGSGGMHVIFQYNSALKTAANVLGKHVDCRNDGGYIVAAPSKHRSGGVYSWVNWGTKIAALPAHLSKRKETRGRKRKNDMFNGRYTIEQVEAMLDHIPADDRDLWRGIGVILGREFKCVDEAWKVYEEWSGKWTGRKARNHDEIMRQAFYELSQESAEKELSIGTIVKAAMDNGWAPKAGEVPISNFVYYGPGNNFIYRPTISYWVASAVDAAVSPVNENGKILSASDWLKANQLATSMTSDPGIDDDYIKGVDCRHGEIVKIPGSAMFNSYRKPTIELGDARLAKPFVEHIKRVFNKEGDADQFINYMAHRVQRPAEKPRFALLIGGPQGIGKDTAIEMCIPAIGTWNVSNIEPAEFDSSFNEYEAATLVRISECANLHEMSKWAFNERSKVIIAGNPDYQIINPKYGQKYPIRRYCGVVVTTNHLLSGIYIPADDRRYDAMETATLEEAGLLDRDERRAYFSELWGWFYEGGMNHVAAYLHEVDLKGFSADNGQRITHAHQMIVQSNMSSDHWLVDALEELDWPTMVRGDVLSTKAVAAGEKEMDVRRKLANAMGRQDYVQFRCPSTKDGRWKINGKLRTIYAKTGTPMVHSADELNENVKKEGF